MKIKFTNIFLLTVATAVFIYAFFIYDSDKPVRYLPIYGEKSYESKNGKTEFFFDLTPQWKAEWGGATFFVTEEGEKLMIPPVPNTLVIAESGRSYVKYVNRVAGKEGRLVVYGMME